MDVLEGIYLLRGIWDSLEDHTVDFMLWYIDELEHTLRWNIGS